MAQRIKDLASSLLGLGLQLWHGINPWPVNFCMPWAWPKKKKEEFRLQCNGIGSVSGALGPRFHLQSRTVG